MNRLFISLKKSCWTCINHWYAHMLNTVHQCGHLVIRKTRNWLRECSIVSQGWFRASPSCHTVKDLNVCDSGVWRKDATEPTSLKYLRWLNDTLEYQRLNCLPQSTSDIKNRSWLNTRVNWKWDGISLQNHYSTDGTVWIVTQWMQVPWTVSRMVCSDWNIIGWVSSRTKVRLISNQQSAK